MQMRLKNSRFRLTVAFTMALCAGAAALACFRSTQNRDAVAAASNKEVAFVDVNVVPMEQERLLTGQTVIVKEGRIVEIGPTATVKIPTAALCVDGRGKYLMPGLADLHVHLESNDEEVNQTLLRMFVAHGVTTVLNLYGTPHHLELRQRIAKGELLGPTLYTSGPFLSNAPHWSPSPDEVERAVVEHQRAGYDFIKIHGDFSREAYAKLFAVSRRVGIRVVGHAPRNLGLEPMFAERQDAVAHAEEYLDAYFFHDVPPSLKTADAETRRRYVAELMKKVPEVAQATAKAGIWVIPTLTVYKGIGLQVKDLATVLRRPEVKYVPAIIAAEWQPGHNTYTRRFGQETVERFELSYALLETLVKGFQAAGVRMVAGTDTPTPCVVPGASLHDELQDLVAAGLTPYEALRTATINAAEFLQTRKESGTVAVGKRADLILIEGDPLKDVANTSKLAGVMVRGRWLTQEGLRALLDEPTVRPTKKEG